MVLQHHVRIQTVPLLRQCSVACARVDIWIMSWIGCPCVRRLDTSDAQQAAKPVQMRWWCARVWGAYNQAVQPPAVQAVQSRTPGSYTI
jgi:hypothetical protein